MKKILIFSHEFPPDVGGAGIVAEQNAKALFQNGYSVTVLTREQKVLKQSNEYKIITVKSSSKLWFLAYKNSIDFDSFDLIFLNDPASIYVAGLFFDKKLLSKSLVFLQGTEPETIYLNPKLSIRLSLFKYFYTKALFKSKSIIAVSKFMKEKFTKQTKLNNISEKIIVNYAGIDNELFFREKDEDFRIKFNIAPDKKILLSVSRIVKEKGYFEMADIFKKLISHDNNYVWIIVGDGADLEKIKIYIKDLHLENFIIFEGSKNREELRYYYSNADIFWLLSNFYESFGLVYLEAQACGCPTIGRNNAGVKEAISDGESGFLVNSEDEVLEILKDKKYLELKEENILNFASNFGLNKQVKVFEKFI